ncbi:hypothetical protein DSO57_1012629 [Entomophthora muscae]|uniref:Uncharacterized protein n=1 Tax=Entomophthora muscae TaxID=34485 RepID=A0ACC2S7M5_9FUNG|nr:hypothetical protein DSO57_1012629 [Entomophthora muscae]
MKLSLVLGAYSGVYALQASTLESQGIIDGPANYIKNLVANGNKEKLAMLLKYKNKVPLVKLKDPSNFKPPERSLLLKGLEFSYMPMCSKASMLQNACICDSAYDSIEYANNLEYKASSLIAYHSPTRLLVVSYKYTSSARNWLTNLDYILTDMEGAPSDVKVHRGMYHHYMSIHNETMSKAAKILATRDVKGVFVTGYSLGGSLAIISTPYWAKFKETNNVPVDVVSYSGARPGNMQAKLYFESQGINIVRYTNKKDVVPSLPPRFAGYVHTGLEIHEHSVSTFKTELMVCSQEFDEDPQCAYGESGRKSATLHYMPFNNLLLLPPFCGKGSLTKLPLPEYIE